MPAFGFNQSSGRPRSRASALASSRTAVSRVSASTSSVTRSRRVWLAAIAAPPTTKIEAATPRRRSRASSSSSRSTVSSAVNSCRRLVMPSPGRVRVHRCFDG